MNEQQLLQRIAALRRRIKVMILLHGLGIALGGGAVVVLLAATLDWLFRLPGPLRLLLACAAAAMVAYLFVRYLLLPLRIKLTNQALAIKLEARFPQLDDRLASTVNFVEKKPLGSEVLARQVVRETTQLAEEIPFEKALTAKRVGLVASGGTLMGLLLITVAILAPTFLQTGLQRFGWPIVDAHWPKKYLIQPISGDAIVPVGEAFTVSMKLLRGSDPEGTLPSVYFQDSSGKWEEQPLRRNRQGVYQYTFESVGGDFRYYFQAGDDDTEDRPFAVRTVRRPAVERLSCSISPPPYATDAAARKVSLQQGRVEAVEGSTAKLLLKTSRKIDVSAGGKAELVFLRPSTEPLGSPQIDKVIALRPTTPGPCDSFVAELDFPPLTEQNPKARAAQFVRPFRVNLLDASVKLWNNQPLDNHLDKTQYQLVTTLDELPTIVVQNPRHDLEVTPKALIDLQIRADDDFGLSELALSYQKLGEETVEQLDLSSWAIRSREGGSFVATVSTQWDLSPLGLEPGDILVYRAKCRDNYQVGSRTHEPVYSSPLRLRIISEEQLHYIIMQQMQRLREQVRQAANAQRNIKAATSTLADDLRQNKKLEPSDRNIASRLSHRQSRLASQTAALQRQFEAVVQMMQTNRVDDQQAMDRIADLGSQVGQVGRGEMSKAAESLRSTAEPRQQDSGKQTEEDTANLQRAQQQQAEAVEKLQKIAEKMARWGDFEDVVAQAREILDEQQQLHQETAELGKQTLGKRPEQLGDEQRRKLENLARRQQQLSERLRNLLDRMEQLAQTTRQQDQNASQALSQAAEAARQNNVSGQMSQASGQIAQNRTSQAQTHQEMAEMGLKEMLNELEKKRLRELQELEQQTIEVIELLKKLLETQENLLQQTERYKQQHLAEVSRWRRLAEKQNRARRNCEDIATQIDQLNAAKAGEATRKAAAKMGRAAHRLAEPDAAQAIPQQQGAIDDLKLAIKELEELLKKLQNELAKRNLEQIKEQLKKVRNAQYENVNTPTIRIAQSIEARGRVLPLHAKQLMLLSQQQAQIHQQMDGIHSRIQQANAVVFEWMSEQILGQMQQVQSRLAEKTADDLTRSLEKQIIDELDMLIAALEKEQSDNQDDFRTPGGGGGGGGGKPRLIPPEAQLKLLRAMQMLINATTKTYDAKFNSDGRLSEDELQEMKKLAERQETIKTLAQKMVEQARRQQQQMMREMMNIDQGRRGENRQPERRQPVRPQDKSGPNE